MIRPENEREDSLLSITRKCQTLIEQTQRKAEKTLEFKLTKPRETVHFNTPISIEGSWMINWTNLEVYNSIFNIKITNSYFKKFQVQRVVVFHMKKSEMRLKITWRFRSFARWNNRCNSW